MLVLKECPSTGILAKMQGPVELMNVMWPHDAAPWNLNNPHLSVVGSSHSHTYFPKRIPLKVITDFLWLTLYFPGVYHEKSLFHSHSHL
jgi:hypothetical protein